MPHMQTEKFRTMHRLRGEPYRHWKAVPCSCGGNDPDCTFCERNGRGYIEQDTSEVTPALFSDTAETVDDTEFGAVAAGVTTISVMPDETRLYRGDKVGRSGSPMQERVQLRRANAGDFDPLPRRIVTALHTVGQDGQVFGIGTVGECDLAVVNDQPGVHWDDPYEAPAPGSLYVVEFDYVRIYLVIGEGRPPRLAREGILMPQRVRAIAEQSGVSGPH